MKYTEYTPFIYLAHISFKQEKYILLAMLLSAHTILLKANLSINKNLQSELWRNLITGKMRSTIPTSSGYPNNR